MMGHAGKQYGLFAGIEHWRGLGHKRIKTVGMAGAGLFL
jgi:hypothetical protein